MTKATLVPNAALSKAGTYRATITSSGDRHGGQRAHGDSLHVDLQGRRKVRIAWGGIACAPFPWITETPGTSSRSANPSTQ